MKSSFKSWKSFPKTLKSALAKLCKNYQYDIISDKWMDKLIEWWMDGILNGWMEYWMDEWNIEWMDGILNGWMENR